MLLLDTHTWLWWLSNPESLSKKAARTIDKAIDENAIAISSISVWEVAMLVERERLQFNTDYRDFIENTEKLSFVKFIPADNTILLRSVTLPDFNHKDPADRIIIATANRLSATLITKDERILNYKYVKTLW